MKEKLTSTPNLVLEWTLSNNSAAEWQILDFGLGKSPMTSELPIDQDAVYNKAVELSNRGNNLQQPLEKIKVYDAAIDLLQRLDLMDWRVVQHPLEKIKAYDVAIQLLQELDLDNQAYRYALAAAHANKGIALKDIGTTQALNLALKEDDEAIRLFRTLGCKNPEYCNSLARAHMNKGDVLKAIGTAQALGLALEEYDKAIQLLRTLDRKNPEYYDNLARAHTDKGSALEAIGTAQALGLALKEYDEAIQLLRNLDRKNPEYCSNLARAHMNKGNALEAIGTAQALGLALKEYDEAIQLLRNLDRKNPKYCNSLVIAYINKGNALQAIGAAQALNLALEEYDEAIQLLRTLGRKNPEYCSNLAITHSNKGNALEAIGTAQALGLALKEYDEANRLLRTLDRKNPKYCNQLAGVHNNKGNALKAIGTAQALSEGVVHCNQAITLLKNYMSQPASQRMVVMVNSTGLAYLNKALCLLLAHDPHNASNAADDGLTLLREQEIGGVFTLRDLREKLFVTTLQAYTQSGQFQFLPEIILEHLDPKSPGSAHTSAKMQDAALYYLRNAIEKLSRQANPSQALLEEIKQTLQKLAEIRIRYFSGTAISARLQAIELERMDNPDGARQVLAKYLEFRPSDPEGHLELAAFFARQQQIQPAINVYHNAAIKLIHRAQARGELEVSIPAVAAIADKILKLKLLHQCFTEQEEIALKQVLELQKWLFSDFCVRLFSADVLRNVTHQWRNELEESLKIVGGRLEVYHNGLVTQLTNRVREEAKKHAWDEFNELTRSMARTLCAGIGLPWDDFQEGVTAAWLERWSHYKNEWHQASAERRAEIEDQIAHGLGYTVGEMTQQLHEKILAGSYAHLQHLLGADIWKAFQDSPEVRLLACGHHWLQLPPSANSARYAGLELGLAVETCLLARLFTPLKEQLQKTGQHATVTIAPDDFSYKTGQFLKGNVSAVEFGPMIGALGRTLKYLDTPDQLTGSSYYRDLAHYLNQLPNPAPLRDLAARKHRAAQLEEIKKRRNQCAHPHDLPTPEELQTLWEKVAGDAQHGFFRYFGAALVAPPTPATAPDSTPTTS